MAGFGIILLIFGLGGFVLWIYALADLLKRPSSQWREADQDRLVWAAVVLFLSIIGAVLYLAIARPALDRAQPSRVG